MRSTSLALAAVLFTACAADVSPPTGRAEVALVGAGADGRHYRLTDGTRLEVRDGDFFETFSLDGNTASIAIDLPVGEYQVRLVHPSGYTDSWPLIRIDADGTEVFGISGTLLTPQPMSVTIAADDTTSLSLVFRVPLSGTITFASGSLEVSAEVDEVEADGAALLFDAEGVSIAAATVFAAAPDSLDTFWPVQGTNGLSAVMAGSLGKWKLQSTTRVCADLAVDTYGATDDTSFGVLFNESVAFPPGQEKVCIYSANAKQYLEVLMVRLGSASSSALFLGQTQYLFVTRLTAELPEAVFVDGTLSLGLLDGRHESLPFSGELSVEEATPSAFVPWYHATLAGTAHVLHQPTIE